MKKIGLSLIVFTMLFLVSCETKDKNGKIEDTLDGIYELMSYHLPYNQLSVSQPLVTYEKYSLNINGDSIRISSQKEHESEQIIDLKIIRLDGYFTIETYEGMAYYHSNDFSYIETVSTDEVAKYQLKMYFQKVGHEIKLDSTDYANKTFEISKVSGYYQLMKVTSEFFLTFEISFIDQDNVKIEIISPNLNYVKEGNYRVYLNSVIIETNDEVIVLQVINGKLSFHYYKIEIGKSDDEFIVEFSEKEESTGTNVLELNYQYDQKTHDEIVLLTRPVIEQAENKLSVEYRYQVSGTHLEASYHKTGNHVRVNEWTNEEHHDINGYVLQPYQGTYYAKGYTSDLPAFDIFSNMNSNYRYSKVGNHYYVKVNNQKFGSSQEMPPIYYRAPISSFELNLDMYLKIEVLDDSIHVAFFNQAGVLFLSAVYQNEHDSDSIMDEMKQVYAASIEAALIPLELELLYEVDYKFFNETSIYDRNNYVKLDLEVGYYYFTGKGMSSTGLYDSNGVWLSDRITRYDNDGNIFAFEVLEDSEPLYLMIRSGATKNYEYRVKKIEDLNLTTQPFEEGTTNIEIKDTPNGVHIQTTFDQETRVQVQFIPLENELGIIKGIDWSRSHESVFENIFVLNENEEFVLTIFSSGTLIITVLK